MTNASHAQFPDHITPPSSDEAEKTVLCAILQDPVNVLPEMRQKIKDEHFYDPGHLIIWQAVCALADKGSPVDYTTLVTYLRDNGTLDKARGAGEISELTTFMVPTSGTPFYVGILKQKLLARQLIQQCQSTIVEVCTMEYPEDVVQVAAKHEAAAFATVQEAQNISDNGLNQKRQIIDQQDCVHEVMEFIEHCIANRGKQSHGIHTGWIDVDRSFGGLLTDSEGDLLVIGGKPGMGKSIAAITLVEQIAINLGHPVAVFPLEMGRVGMQTRMLLGRAGVDTNKSRSGHFSHADQQAISTLCSREDFLKAPIHWDPSSFIETAELQAKIQVLVRKHGVRAVVIDHMGQIKASGKKGKEDDRYKIIEIMETLHRIRKDMGLLIILCCQLSKDADKNGGLPQMSDLRGAAEIEEYASHIMFCHRPPEYRPWLKLNEEKQEEWRRITEPFRRRNPELWADSHTCDDVARRDYEEHALLRIVKNRHGPTGEICVRFHKQIQRFITRTKLMYSNNWEDRQVELPGFF